MRLLIYLALIVLVSCKSKKEPEKGFQKGEYENYDPDKFYEDRGIVYDANEYYSKKYKEQSIDIFYMYNLKGDTLRDVIKESTLFGLYEGDVITVLVHEDDRRVNYYNGRGFRKPKKSKKESVSEEPSL